MNDASSLSIFIFVNTLSKIYIATEFRCENTHSSQIQSLYQKSSKDLVYLILVSFLFHSIHTDNKQQSYIDRHKPGGGRSPSNL